jgi:DNA-binding NarL/FixJ family response regulator
MFSFKILVVDDYEPFRRLICSILKQRADCQVVAEASDGLEALQKAVELKPDLILLDIGLPKLTGIEVGRQLRKLVPDAKILYLSQEVASDVVREAIKLGAAGYVQKMRTNRDLLTALDLVIEGKQFVSSNLQGWESDEDAAVRDPGRHEVQFYSEDEVFLESFTRFIAAALRAGHAAIAIATQAHLDGILLRLKAESVDIEGAIQKRTFVSIDVADSLSSIMVDGFPDPIRFFEGIRGPIELASKATKAEHPRVAFCGERVGLLWAEGKTDAAIRLEQLCNDLIKTCDVDMLCAYPRPILNGGGDEQAFKRICEEHTTVHSR